jgi:uncharacterized surface protein with fasciclin (FAS1) repeats
LPLVHLATIPLPPDVADYGNPAVEDLGPDDALIVLKEFDPSEAGAALFAADGLPRVLDPNSFDEQALLRTLSGQAGAQLFFHEAARAFCLYVVLGSSQNRVQLVTAVNSVLATVQIEPTDPAPVPAAPTEPEPETVLDIVRGAADLITLTDLVASAALEPTLDGVGPLTLFAPTDAAFSAFPELEAVRADPARLSSVLHYHVLPVRIGAADVGDGRTEPTLEGPAVTLTTRDGVVLVNDTPVTRELGASNGVVLVIDAVLAPPTA